MSSQAREIRWTKPALDFFLDELEATEKDIESVGTILVYIRDNPDDEQARLPVEKNGYDQLRAVQGDIFVSYDAGGRWEVYYSWLPAEIVIVHIELIR
jgi:hypothetical protein